VRDEGYYFHRCKHPEFNSGGRQVYSQVCKGLAEDGWIDRIGGGYAKRRLDRECGDGGGSEEAVGGEDLEVGGDAGAAGGIESGDGQDDGRFGRTGYFVVLRREGHCCLGNPVRFFSGRGTTS